MDVTIFSAAGCGKCVATKYQLKKREIPFHEVKVNEHEGMADTVRNAVGPHLPVLMAFRHDEDEVPDIITDFHPSFVDALLDTGMPIPDPC